RSADLMVCSHTHTHAHTHTQSKDPAVAKVHVGPMGGGAHSPTWHLISVARPAASHTRQHLFLSLFSLPEHVLSLFSLPEHVLSLSLSLCLSGCVCVNV